MAIGFDDPGDGWNNIRDLASRDTPGGEGDLGYPAGDPVILDGGIEGNQGVLPVDGGLNDPNAAVNPIVAPPNSKPEGPVVPEDQIKKTAESTGDASKGKSWNFSDWFAANWWWLILGGLLLLIIVASWKSISHHGKRMMQKGRRSAQRTKQRAKASYSRFKNRRYKR